MTINASRTGSNLFARRWHRAGLLIASAACISACGVAAIAESPQSKPAPQADAKKSAPEPTLAQAFAELSREIEALQVELQKGDEHLTANPAQQTAKAVERINSLLQVQKRLVELAQSGDVNRAITAEQLGGTPVKTTVPLKASWGLVSQPQVEQMKEQLQVRDKQLSEREKQLAAVSQQLVEMRRVPLPPLENGTMKVYKLNFVPARDAAQTVESLFGAQALRLAVDERGNTLIAYSKPESIAALDSLVVRLDEEAASAASPDKKRSNTAALPRSLMVRVFWLADGLPQNFGQNPIEYLPKSVLAATAKLGLESPRLVVQTVNALATNKDDAVSFSTNVPAALFEQPVVLNCQGKLKLVADDRVRVDMYAHVVGNTTSCDLEGSMTTPLGHYMVLGTANSRFAQGGIAAGAMPGAAGEMGMAGPAGPGDFQPGAAHRGRGAASPGGELGMAGPAPDGTMPGGEEPAAVKPNYTTSRFAFVVEVVEGQSFASDETTVEGFRDPAPGK